MGVSTEILARAYEKGLRVEEVPVTVSYDEESSSQNPLVHGFQVILSTLKHISIHRPLLFYGLPGFTSIITAVILWGVTLQKFTKEGILSTGLTLIAMSCTIVGLMLMTTAIIIWVLVSILRETTNARE